MLNHGHCISSFLHAPCFHVQVELILVDMKMTEKRTKKKAVGWLSYGQRDGEHPVSPLEISRLPIDLKHHLGIVCPTSNQRDQ